MTWTPAERVVRRALATEFVTKINAATTCAVCGGGPSEWHGEHHPAKPNARVSSLRTQGASIERIKAEMAVCTPLCRACHMAEDGRGRALHAAAPRQLGMILVAPQPCADCGRLTKPTRRGRCNKCYMEHMGIRRPKRGVTP